jgi:hypothetical protein
VGFIVPPALYWGTREEEGKTLARGVASRDSNTARESFVESCARHDRVRALGRF